MKSILSIIKRILPKYLPKSNEDHCARCGKYDIYKKKREQIQAGSIGVEKKKLVVKKK
jgi:hypothetical protein